MHTLTLCMIWIFLLFTVIPAARSRHESDSPSTYDGLSLVPGVRSTHDCTYTKFSSYVPSAALHKSDLSNLEMLYRLKSSGVMTEAKCAELCCNYDSDCQYAWLYESDCYAVSCSSELESLCEPYSGRAMGPSVYIQVHQTGRHPPVDSSNEYHGDPVHKGEKAHRVKPSLAVASPVEGSSLELSTPISIKTTASEHLVMTALPLAMKTPQPTTLPATSEPPAEPYKPPEGEVPVNGGKPTVKV